MIAVQVLQLVPEADLLWVMTASVLVFLMQVGFLALEAGLTRSKNAINVAIKNMADFGISTLLFWVFGFGLMFGTTQGGWFGTDEFAVSFSEARAWPTVFFLFQVMFCGTAVTILSGAVAERLRFGAYMFLAVLVAGLTYPLFGHWAWNGLDIGESTGWLAQRGFVDFAGSTVVHSVGGWTALAVLLVIGARAGRFPDDGPPQKIVGSNLPMATLGALLLFVGWLGFNGGSTLSLGPSVGRVLANTVLAGSAGMVVAMAVGAKLVGRPEIDHVINGALGGLVAITANAHAVDSPAAFAIGAIGGVVVLGASHLLERFRIDDAVGAVPVHLAAGIWGTMATGIFGEFDLLGTGLGRMQQIGVQALGVGTAFVSVFCVTLAIVVVANRIRPFRVPPEAEEVGLNVSEHGATTELLDFFQVMDTQTKTGDLALRAPVEPFTEVGQIAARYNQMMETLETNDSELKEYHDHLEEQVESRTSDLRQANADLSAAQIEMAANEARFRSLFEDSPVSVWEEDYSRVRIALDEIIESGVTDLRAHFREHAGLAGEVGALIRVENINQATLDLYGAESKDQLLGSLEGLLGESSESELADQLAALAEGQLRYEAESVLYRLNGETGMAIVSVSIAPGAQESWSKVFVSVVDITDRQEAERLLGVALEQLESTDTIIERWTPDGRVVEMNQFGLDLFGFSADEVIGRDGSETFRSPDGGWEEERAALFANPGESVESETECRRSDGTPIWVAWRNSPILDEDNNIVAVISIGIDITERRDMEMQVKAAKERMEKELNVARDIQMSMVPLDFPAFPDREEFSIYAILEPAREVGGDFYDFFLIDHDHLCFTVGDVSDKGVPAALFMAVTKTLIKSHAASDLSPASIMTAANDELCENNESSMFVTIFLCILDLRTGEMVYTNAGHNPPYIKTSAGELITLDQRHGPVAGAIGGVAYGEDRLKLTAGDYVVMFTDGVTEAMSPNRELYSEDALETLLIDSGLDEPTQAVALVYDAIVDHQDGAEQSDDITVLSLEFKSSEEILAERLVIVMPNTLEGVGSALQQLDEFAGEEGIEDKVRRPVLLALDDLLNNVVSYAFPDGSDHEIEISVDVSAHRFAISVSDDGMPFNPFGLDLPDTTASIADRGIGGLGIHLVRTLMDEYRYERRGGRNVVTVAKYLDSGSTERESA